MRTVTVQIPVTGLWQADVEIPDDVEDVQQYIQNNSGIMSEIETDGWFSATTFDYLAASVEA